MFWILIFLLALFGCEFDEGVSAYAPEGAVYELADMDGAPFTALATLRVDVPGRISGEAPCNSYAASQTAPYPWFSPGAINATRRTCPELEAETAFLDALAAMTLVETQGDTLILSNTDGREMIFYARP